MKQKAIDKSGATQGTFKLYVIGFILSVVLTAVAFWVVISGTLTYSAILTIIFAAAVAQILVHLHYFLHLDFSSEAQWNMLAMVFTVLILVLFVGGTLWIMHDLNYRMM